MTETFTAACLPQFVEALTEPDAFSGMLDGLADGVYLVDRRRTIRFWNAASERISGYSSAEVVGRHCFDNILRHVDAEGTRLCFGPCPLAGTMSDGVPREADVWLHHKDGHRVPVQVRTTPIRDHDGAIIGAIEFFTDESQLQATEDRVEELERLALSDPLTSLPNRRYLEVALGSRLSEARRHGRALGVVFADIDHFKQVNDSHGHDVGDRVLKMVASTLSASLRAGDMVARFGGEEFVLLLPDAGPDTLLETCERLRMLVRTSSVDLGPGNMVEVAISMGATIARPHDSAASVLKRADGLLYASKDGGRDRVAFGA